MICIDSGAVGAVLFAMIVAPMVPPLMDALWAGLSSYVVSFLLVAAFGIFCLWGCLWGAYNYPEAFFPVAGLLIFSFVLAGTVGALLGL